MLFMDMAWFNDLPCPACIGWPPLLLYGFVKLYIGKWCSAQSLIQLSKWEGMDWTDWRSYRDAFKCALKMKRLFNVNTNKILILKISLIGLVSLCLSKHLPLYLNLPYKCVYHFSLWSPKCIFQGYFMSSSVLTFGIEGPLFHLEQQPFTGAGCSTM